MIGEELKPKFGSEYSIMNFGIVHGLQPPSSVATQLDPLTELHRLGDSVFTFLKLPDYTRSEPKEI
jgi:hypothetical protein